MKTVGLSVPLLVLLAACGQSKAPEAPPAPARAKITVDAAPVPARYAAPLPKSLASLDAWIPDDPAAPPLWHTVDTILNGDARGFARLSEAANAVPPAEAAAYAKRWTELVRFHTPGKAFCAQARPLIAGPPATARAVLVGLFAEYCAKAEDLPLMVRADTPNPAVLAYFNPFRVEDGFANRFPFHPRLIEAARETILQSEGHDARSVAFILAERGDAKTDAALLAIHSAIKDPERGDQVALAFFRSKNAEGLTRAKAACKRLVDDPMCSEDDARARAALEDDAPAGERPSAKAIQAKVAALQAAGFSKLDASKLEKPDSDAAENILLSAGLAYWFDVETGMFPNQHDTLMRNLALLVSPTLQDVIFEEKTPGGDDDSIPYQLTVYAAGKRYRAQADNYGDWYDVITVLQLLNRVMEDLKAPERFTPLESTDQTMIVVAATPATMANAVKAGLLKTDDDPRNAERRGKAFEVEVRKALPAR
jgi:hypothetical protein